MTRDDVVGVYAGLRPLLAGESDQTSKLSREHACVSPVPGLVIVAGGKYTTYRVMAEDAINEAVKGLPGKVGKSITHETPLIGADGYKPLWATRANLATRTGIDLARIEHLLGRYGSSIHELLALAEAEPELLQPLSTAPKYLKVEAKYAVTHEGALHLDDILARRTRISIDTWDRGDAAAQEVAELVAPDPRLGCRRRWSGRWRTTAHGWPPSVSRSRCPTTKPPTPHGSVRKMSGSGLAEP